MTTIPDHVLTVDVTPAANAVTAAAVAELDRHADAIAGVPPLPGTPEWEAEQGTDVPVQRETAWRLVAFRIGLAAGLDLLPHLVALRHTGVSWDTIGRAAGITRQSAHERWAPRVAAVVEGHDRTAFDPATRP
ncbi:hypothetical protein AD006_00820 [Pseudonocardia sp. EC080610-09]|uniref:hypothetical protein n=1 Tax=unclassified Pseudonocardia TaxID=2619320 RepID=UPI0006CB2BB5|nr:MULTISPECIES: hypothetical protein [unclassified Pseudonocardia]ALE74887.1 hypothetical protein FRP1_21645 [Pseudonocardia sp. EC080625-04]ALL74223.1 hypothetical protein AD006_00820 [Pseudonocardia sp. EC080610-09]